MYIEKFNTIPVSFIHEDNVTNNSTIVLPVQRTLMCRCADLLLCIRIPTVTDTDMQYTHTGYLVLMKLRTAESLLWLFLS